MPTPPDSPQAGHGKVSRRQPPTWVTRYWGKAHRDGQHLHLLAYHLLAYHLLDVAAIAHVALEQLPSLVPRFCRLSKLDTDSNTEAVRGMLTLLAALHDVGKFANGFQQKAPRAVRELGRSPIPSSEPERHDHQAFRLLGRKGYRRRLLEALGLRPEDLPAIIPWLAATWGHHGVPPLAGQSASDLRLQFPLEADTDGLQIADDLFAAIEWLRRTLGPCPPAPRPTPCTTAWSTGCPNVSSLRAPRRRSCSATGSPIR